MISAYDEEWFLSVNPNGDLDAHIQETLLARSERAVKAAIFEYLIDQNPAPQVFDLLNRLTANRLLLSKVWVVSDRQWGTCTILVTPGEARIGAGGIHRLDGTVDLEATLQYWTRSAEAVLVQLAEEGHTEERKPLLESLQWLTHWQFKRQFDRVLNQTTN